MKLLLATMQKSKSIHRRQNIMLHTWNLDNVVNQRNLNLKTERYLRIKIIKTTIEILKKKKKRRKPYAANGRPWMGRRRYQDPWGLLLPGAGTHSLSSIPHSKPIAPFYRRGSRCSEKWGDLPQVVPSSYWQSWNSSSALDLKAFPDRICKFLLQ